MNAKLALIATLIFAQLATSSVIKRKEDQGVSSPKDYPQCNYKVLNMFSLSKNQHENYDFATPDEDTKKICPSLDVTCCNVEALKGQLEFFKAGYLQVREYMFVHSNITASLRSHKVKPKKTAYIDPTCKDSEDFYQQSEHLGDSPTAESTPEGLMSMYLFEMEESLKHHKTVNYTISKYYSGFTCGMCHPTVQAKFGERSKIKADETLKAAFRMGLTSYKAHTQMFIEILEYWISLGRAYEIFKRLPAKQGFETDIDFKHPKELQCALTKVKQCLDIKSIDELLSRSKICMAGLEIGFFMDITLKSFDSVRAVLRDMNEYFFLHFNDLKMFPRSAEALPVKFEFARPNIDTDPNWDDVAFDMEDDGFDMTRHVFNEKVWFLSAMRVGASLLVAAVAGLLF